MIYSNIKKAKFISRPNRFIAIIESDGTQHNCHVKNTGRLGELLIPGCTVYVQVCNEEHRKTKFDLIAVESENQIINIDSQAPNKLFGEWIEKSGLFKNISLIKPECKYKNSRFDFYIECENRRIFAEIKGVTLKENSAALFPDAPTQRGVRHLNELCLCIDEGYEAYVFFIVKMKGVTQFMPNHRTHPEFAQALKKAESHGVKIYAVDCNVESSELKINQFIDVIL